MNRKLPLLSLLFISQWQSAAVGAEFVRTLNAAPAGLRTTPVPAALFGANVGYWSSINTPELAAAAQEAGLTVLRYHPGTYNDPNTVPGSINMWDFTAVDDFGAARLDDFGRFLIATGAAGQISINYGAGSPAQAAALVAYLRVPADAPAALLNLSLGSAVVEPTNSGTRTRDWRTVGFWADLRASAPLPVDDGLNKLRLSHPAPFPMKYWECGNEADYSFVPCYRYKVPGETSITQGATSAQGYRADARNYANFYAAAKALMQQVDPTIEVGASAGYFEQGNNDTNSAAVPYLFPGSSGTTRAWTPVMLTRLREIGVVPDFIIAHRYTQQTDFAWNNNYLLRGALRGYLASPAQGDLPRIHVTELNWSDNEFVPYTSTINNAVNLARSFGDALQNDVNNLSWFTFTSGPANYNPASTTGWRRYHNWGIISDDPLAGQPPNTAAVNWPGMFPGVRFPTFHAFALLKDFARPGDHLFNDAALSPANTNGHAVTVFGARRQGDRITLLVLNKEDTSHTLNLTLSGIDANLLPALASVRRYGKAQDEEQRIKSIANPPVLTNNSAEALNVPLTANLLSYTVPPLSISTFTLDLIPPAAPTFTSANAATALLGQAFTFDLNATPGPVTYTTGTLPGGLVFDASNGRISGTPTTTGESSIELTATNAGGSRSSQLALIVVPVNATPLVIENFDAGNTAGWFAYSGDGGVSHSLTNQANGTASSPALNLNFTVTAPPATYWYGGLGKGFSGPPPFTLGNLPDRKVSLDLWVSATPTGRISLIFKTPNNGTLTRTLDLPGNAWNSIGIPLTDFTNSNFDYTAPSWEFLVIKENAGWPLASSAIRMDRFSLDSLTPAYTALQLWRHNHFSTHAPVGIAADETDADADGYSNLLEFALGTTPNAAISKPVLSSGISNQRLQLTFTPQVVTGLNYSVESSENLVQWTPFIISPPDLTIGAPHTHTDSVVIPDPDTPRRFLRLRVNRQ